MTTRQTPDAVREAVTSRPMVKPLDWRAIGQLAAYVEAPTGATYAIQEFFGWDNRFQLVCRVADDAKTRTTHWPTLAEAKDAAQSDHVARILAALDSRAGDAGEGWKLVPVEPTDAMREAAIAVPIRSMIGTPNMVRVDYDEADAIWSAMLAATPAPAVDAPEQFAENAKTAVDAVPAGEVRAKTSGWRKNAAGFKDGAQCYRTIGGVRWSWWAEDASVFKRAGIRHRRASGGDGTFIHPDDSEKAFKVADGRASLSHGEGRK